MNLERFRNIFQVRKTHKSEDDSKAHKFEHDPSGVFDSHSCLQDNPPSCIVGERIIEVPGLKSKEGFEAEINNGEVKKVIEDLHKNGKEIVVNWSAGKIILYTAGAAGVIGIVGGGIFLLKRKHEEQSK